jgi:hypothetical protein
MLEAALWGIKANETERLDGREYLRFLEFDVANERWTAVAWRRVLSVLTSAKGAQDRKAGHSDIVRFNCKVHMGKRCSANQYKCGVQKRGCTAMIQV